MLLISWPPGVLLWVAIHPFARQWRRLGPVWTYAILGVPSLLMAAAIWRSRGWLLAIDYGTSYLRVALGVVAAVVSAMIAVERRKQLTFRILAGIPELTRGPGRGTILRDGIYGKLRHPRYVEALLAVLAFALVANYLTLYVLLLLSLPALYLVVILEERELRERFGAEYVAYCREVPRFLPKSWRGES